MGDIADWLIDSAADAGDMWLSSPRGRRINQKRLTRERCHRTGLIWGSVRGQWVLFEGLTRHRCARATDSDFEDLTRST